jgi:argininosuccinate lyase
MKHTGRVHRFLRPRLRRLLFGQRPGRRGLRDLAVMARVDRAHVVMLAECGILEHPAAGRLLAAIEALAADRFAPLLDREPSRGLYSLYEDHLMTSEGAAIGGMLQTARSRNDLQATMLRLRIRPRYGRLVRSVLRLLDTLIEQARCHRDLLMPLHTHGQVAVPDTLGHYYAAVAQAIGRDVEALLAASAGLQACPLGAGAIGGTEFPIDTRRTASLLGFDRGPLNAIDAVAGRDFILRLLAATATCGITLSRIAADLWLWSTAEFGFLQFPDELVGVSSAMPQKRNPFVLEHVLGRGTDAFGALATASLAMHAKPYTNSISAGSEAAMPLDRALRRATEASIMLRAMIAGARPQPDAMRLRATLGYADATALANHLVRAAGFDFRRAHALVGDCVGDAITNGRPLRDVLAARLSERDRQPMDLPGDLDAIVRVREYGGGPGPAAFEACEQDLVRRAYDLRQAFDRLDVQWAASETRLDAASRVIQASASRARAGSH